MENGAAASSSASAASRPSAHTQRYDRQLRLWASSGQTNLENASILVLGATHLGACTLKNLILPGIGSFTLVDGSKVTDYDLGNNFFVNADSKGKGRAQEVVTNLCELNPAVKGYAREDSPHTFITNDSLEAYTLIISVNQPHRTVLSLAKKAWQAKEGRGIPLMALSGAGLVGEVMVQIKEATIVETHPDSIVDLRLTRPWPALQQYADEYKVEGIDSMEHSHVPYIVILLRKLSEWKKSSDGKLPEPANDRKAFTDSINSFRQAENADAENVDEALEALGQHVWRPISTGQLIPESTQALFKDASCSTITSKSSNFWLLVRALQTFVKRGDGSLPLPGALPDMKALSATYIELQRLYREKAKDDLAMMKEHLQATLSDVGLPVDTISDDELESFTKHASFLKFIRGRPLQESIESANKAAIAEGFMDPLNPVVIPHHLAFLAAEQFFDTHDGRYPDSDNQMTQHLIGSQAIESKLNGSSQTLSTEDTEAFDADVTDLLSIAESLMASLAIDDPTQQEAVFDACRDFARSGHADLPSTSALLGGIASQEAIKIVTKQYIPIDNTVVYDGVKQAIGVFRL